MWRVTVTVSHSQSPVDASDDFNFITYGNSTKIVQNCTVEAKGYLMGCMFPYFKGTLKDLSLGYMNDFKKLAEK